MKFGNLSDDQMYNFVKNIPEPTYEFMKNKIMDELDHVKSKKKDIDLRSVIGLLVVTLASLDANILAMIKNIYRGTTNSEIDIVTLMTVYFKNVTQFMSDDELKRLKEKMN
mgnify:FL=1